MVSEGAVCDIKLSTVVPARITGEDKNHHLSDMDLTMKLHYITTVHFFGGDAAAGLTISDFKKPMFKWLQLYYPICGRLRRCGGGRPYVKCNDSGVRIVEATCTNTLAEWLQTVNGGDHHRLLVYHQNILAHDFGFTPFVFLQITKFKCGGVCVGMRWAHFLGDAFAASECINTWGKMMANQKVAPHAINIKIPPAVSCDSCVCVKLLESLGDNWLTPNKSKLQMHSFHVTEKKLRLLSPSEEKMEAFDLICAMVWKSMAKIRGTKMVSICKKRGGNQLGIGVVEGAIGNGDGVAAVREMVAKELRDETRAIERRMEEGDGNLDFVVYGGSNLTFLNLEQLNLYGLQLKPGEAPIFADLSVGGVGDEGAVLVLPGSAPGGRVVNVILPQDQLLHLKNDLNLHWGIF